MRAEGNGAAALNGVFAEGYAYDALGRRVSTTTAEGTTRHVYDDNWQVIADIDEQGNVVASYTWGAGIDRLLAVRIGGANYYPLTDIQGTVWGYVDSANNVVARWQYDAWGNVVDEDVSVAALATLRYRFQGRELSAATGLVHFRNRWFDCETGRWLSKDPIRLSGGLNLYAFCGNDPVNCTDSLGLKKDNKESGGSRGGSGGGNGDGGGSTPGDIILGITDGSYFGTGFGESALNYYCNVIDSPDSTVGEKTGAYVGGMLSALWTRETYWQTALTLFGGWQVRNVAYVDVVGGVKPKLQFRNQRGKPIFRVEKHPLGKGAERNKPRWHYHRPPDMKKHRPYQGGW